MAQTLPYSDLVTSVLYLHVVKTISLRLLGIQAIRAPISHNVSLWYLCRYYGRRLLIANLLWNYWISLYIYEFLYKLVVKWFFEHVSGWKNWNKSFNWIEDAIIAEQVQMAASEDAE